MDKEKQIDFKQMANTCSMYHSCALCPYNPEDRTIFIGKKWKGGCPNYDRKLVYAMGQGYRKITDNEVVISEEEYKNDFSNQFNKGYKNGCKETAEKFVNLPDSDILIVNTQEYGEIEVVPIERLQEIAKQFGVEIGEVEC